jgi:hypothetical protein
LARNGEVLLYYTDYDSPAGSLRAFDIATEQSYLIAADVVHVELGPNENRLLAFGEGALNRTLYYVDLGTETVTEIAQDLPSNGFHINEDWSQASWEDSNGDLHGWIPSTAAPTQVGSIDGPFDAQYSQSANRMAWREPGATTERIAAWNTDGVVEKTVPLAIGSPHSSLRLSADGTILTYKTGTELHVWNLDSGTDQLASSDFDGIFGRVERVAPDGSHVVYQPQDRSLWVFDVAAGSSVQLTASPDKLLFADDFSALLFTHDEAADSHSLSVWKKATGAVEQIATSVHSQSFTPSGEVAVFVTAFDDVTSTGTLNVWNAASGTRTVLAGVSPAANYDFDSEYSRLMFFTDPVTDPESGTRSGSLHTVSLAAGDSVLVDSNVEYSNSNRGNLLRFASDGTGFLYAKNFDVDAVTADYHFYEVGGSVDAVATGAYYYSLSETSDGTRWRFADNYRRSQGLADVHFWERATGAVADVDVDVTILAGLQMSPTTDRGKVVYANGSASWSREVRVWSADTGTSTALTSSAGRFRVDLPSDTVGLLLDPDVACVQTSCLGQFSVDQLGFDETPAIFGTDISASIPLAQGIWAFWSEPIGAPKELFLAVPNASAAP